MARRWYVIHTYSGYEQKVVNDLLHRIENYGIKDVVTDIKVPTEEVTKIKEGGKRETKEQKILPGYVLVQLRIPGREVDDRTWSIITHTQGVTGFVGIEGKPTPLRRSEFEKIMRRASPGSNMPAAKRTETDIEAGMVVKVTSGPLADFTGTVSEVNGNKVKVTVSIFGRDTSVELSSEQVAVVG